MEQHHNSSAFC